MTLGHLCQAVVYAFRDAIRNVVRFRIGAAHIERQNCNRINLAGLDPLPIDSAGDTNDPQHRQQSAADYQPELAELPRSVRLNNAETCMVDAFVSAVISSVAVW